ncbi:MAG: polysaccharide deacetylase family protein [Coriobacteriales bacterium]|nr:polysaccharide deacetylase family protein [Coriobacteriales bacterium]
MSNADTTSSQPPERRRRPANARPRQGSRPAHAAHARRVPSPETDSRQEQGSRAEQGNRQPRQRRAQGTQTSTRTRPPAQHRSAQTRQQASQQGYQRQRSPQGTRNTRRRKSMSPLAIILIVVVLAGVGVGGFFLVRQLMSFKVTVNGQETTVHAGDKVEKLLKEGLVSPKPGNLLAVDGSMLTEGGGEVCSVTINDAQASVDSELTKDAVVQIGDGGDTTEESDSSEEAIPFERKDDDTSFGAYWNGSIHLLSDGKDGVKTTRTGKISGRTVSEVTTQPINAGYRIYTANPSDKVIALTFDDGPWPETTNQILDILEQNGAKATFFTIGNQIAEQPDAVKRAAQMGCQICTHSWDHAAGTGNGVDLTTMSASEQVEEIQKGYKAIADVLGEEPAHILRAPGGNFHDEIITNLWDYVDAEIGWDVDTEDWSRPGVEAISNMIMSVKPGQVILMHDGGGEREQTVEALKECLPKLVEEGYSFVTINELLAYGMPS